MNPLLQFPKTRNRLNKLTAQMVGFGPFCKNINAPKLGELFLNVMLIDIPILNNLGFHTLKLHSYIRQDYLNTPAFSSSIF